MRIVFMGTPEFSVPCLDRLIENGYEIAAVVTQPDKPVGRKQSVPLFTPVKKAALEHGIKEILQPEKVRTQEFIQKIKDIAPDLIVTVAYGKILPQDILDIPRFGCINVHGSLLPKYRGAAPIQWAIINGDNVTGITTMYMDAGMDTGDMLLKKEVAINDNMTFLELYDMLEKLGAETLLETLEMLKDGKLVRKPQNHAEAITVPMMKKEMGLIDWKKSAWEIHNLVRGTDPWPGAFTFYKGGRLKIWKTSMIGIDEPFMEGFEDNPDTSSIISSQPGKIYKILKDSLIVATGKGFLKILELQFESGKKMGISQCGHNMDEGEIFG